MPEEMVMTHAATGMRPRASWILWTLVSVVILLIAALAGFAFAGMFTAVRDEMIPFFHALAWIVPVGVDVGILALTASGLLLEWLLMPMPALRWVAMTFMGASVWLNIAAANGSVRGSVGHAALPVLFIACIEAIRHAVRRTAGMAAGTIRDGIPLARWILAPVPTFLMFRRMVLQRVNSYTQAVQMDLARRRDIARIKAHYAGRPWRKAAPDDLVWMLRKGISLTEATARVTLLTQNVPAVPARKAAAGSAGTTGSPVPGSRRGVAGTTVPVPGDGPVPGSGAIRTTGSGNRVPVPATAGSGTGNQNRLRDTGELLSTACGINEAWRQVHGRDITADPLRKRMAISKQTACALLRQIKAESTPAVSGVGEGAR